MSTPALASEPPAPTEPLWVKNDRGVKSYFDRDVKKFYCHDKFGGFYSNLSCKHGTPCSACKFIPSQPLLCPELNYFRRQSVVNRCDVCMIKVRFRGGDSCVYRCCFTCKLYACSDCFKGKQTHVWNETPATQADIIWNINEKPEEVVPEPPAIEQSAEPVRDLANEVEEAMKMLEAAKTDADDLRGRLEKANDDNANKEKALSEAESKMAALRVETLTKDNASQEKEIDAAQQQLNKMKEEADELKNRVEELSNESKEQQTKIKMLTEERDELVRQSKCGVCLENVKDTIMDCGHVSCRRCVADISKCPVCRENIRSTRRIFN